SSRKPNAGGRAARSRNQASGATSGAGSSARARPGRASRGKDTPFRGGERSRTRQRRAIQRGGGTNGGTGGIEKSSQAGVRLLVGTTLALPCASTAMFWFQRYTAGYVVTACVASSTTMAAMYSWALLL